MWLVSVHSSMGDGLEGQILNMLQRVTRENVCYRRPVRQYQPILPATFHCEEMFHIYYLRGRNGLDCRNNIHLGLRKAYKTTKTILYRALLSTLAEVSCWGCKQSTKANHRIFVPSKDNSYTLNPGFTNCVPSAGKSSSYT